MITKPLRRKFIFLAVLTLAAILFSLPSFTKNLPSALQKILSSDGMRLGLDLQGGMNLILKVNLAQAVQSQLEQSLSDFNDELKANNISAGPAETVGPNHVHLQLLNASDMAELRRILTREFPNLVLLSSSQNAGAADVDLALSPKEVNYIEDNSVAQSLEIIRNRIDQFGVSEPMLVKQGKDEIVVQLPGVKDPERALELIGRTAQLQFKLVDSQAGIDLPGLIDKAIASGRLKKNFSHQELNLALFLNLILMMAALSVFRATLTLPGIAGIVLSIGMAVDSNVLIFERMREEVALNKPIRSAVAGGYDKALWTIVDSHITTLITAFALFLFGTGPIKGFAVTLSIGVIFNLFTALYGTRAVYDYLNLNRRIKALHFLQIIKNSRIDFLRLRNAAFLLSGLLVVMGIFAFVQIQRGKANLGVEFAGGTIVQLKAQKPFRLAEIRDILNRNNLTDYELQDVPGQNILIVRIKQSKKTVGAVADQVTAALVKELPDKGFVVESKAEIGASVSRDLKQAALIAIAISMAGIIIYLGWRFDLRFGIAAAVATFHDVLTVLGIFYLLNKEITLLVVTALLTLAGYSLTDTVVVFDRIRENLRKKGKSDLGQVINQSINEVLSRTIITSGTVLMVLVALLLMGGILLRDFALALTIGVVVGTYSSIFVASPLVYIWPTRRRMAAKAPVKTGKSVAP